MKIRLHVSAIVFLGSYFPLSVILLFQDVNYEEISSILRECCSESLFSRSLKNPEFSLPAVVISGTCFLVAMLTLRLAQCNIPTKIVEAKYVPSDLMNYTLPYVVSFMTLDYQEAGKFLGLLIFLAWIFLITHRAGQVILNPLLIVFGWRHYEIRYEFEGGQSVYTNNALSRSKLYPRDRVLHGHIQDIMVVTKNEEQEGQQ